jgi:hypothetical protein
VYAISAEFAAQLPAIPKGMQVGQGLAQREHHFMGIKASPKDDLHGLGAMPWALTAGRFDGRQPIIMMLMQLLQSTVQASERTAMRGQHQGVRVTDFKAAQRT